MKETFKLESLEEKYFSFMCSGLPPLVRLADGFQINQHFFPVWQWKLWITGNKVANTRAGNTTYGVGSQPGRWWACRSCCPPHRLKRTQHEIWARRICSHGDGNCKGDNHWESWDICGPNCEINYRHKATDIFARNVHNLFDRASSGLIHYSK